MASSLDEVCILPIMGVFLRLGTLELQLQR